MATRKYSSLIESIEAFTAGPIARIPTCKLCLVLLCISNLSLSCDAWIPTEFSRLRLSQTSPCTNSEATRLCAKKNRNSKRPDENSWYDSVDDDATPQEVFWNEMERQRMANQAGESSNQDPYIAAAMNAAASSSSPGDMMGASSVDALSNPPSRTSNAGASTYSPNGGGGGGSGSGFGAGGGTSGEDLAALEPKRKPASMEEQKAADAALSEYELFEVDDNWLDEALQERMMSLKADLEEDERSMHEQTEDLLDQLESLPDGYGSNRDDLLDDGHESKSEPWDTYGLDESETSDIVGGRKIPFPEPGKSFSIS